MTPETSDIKKSIERAIREGVGQEYLGIVKELKNSYYLEDVAAAAIALYARQGGKKEPRVQRRTLHDMMPAPHKTTEAKGAGEKKKPVMPPAKSAPVRKEHNVHNVQKGHGGHPVAEGHGGRTGQAGKNRRR
jgi:hypothetical protein